jgi:hypothetical protein
MTIPLLLARLFFLLLSLPLAQDGGLELMAAAGFDGLYEPSRAVPLVVSARNNGAAVEGEIQVLTSSTGDAGGLIFSAPLSLPTGADKRIPLTIYVPPFGGSLIVRLVSDGAVLAETRTNRLNGVSRDDLLYGVISPDPGGLAFLETIPGSRADAAVAYLSPGDLPEVASAWDALDVLVLDDTDTSRLTAGQSAALQAWVEGGGQLVVTGGPGGPMTAAGVADLLPVSVRGVESSGDLPALAEFGGEAFGAPGPYVVATSDLATGETLIDQDGLPLLARRALGRGSVYFLALDPKAAPLAGWPGGVVLWDEIASGAPVLPPWAWGIQDGYAAAQAVSYVQGLSLPSVWQLVLFLLLYTAIIGPINFLILRRINRRELAWITIPALVLLFSAVTFFTGFRTRGNNATLNIMSVAYGSANADTLRTQSVMGLYSPRRGRYDITLPYDSAAFPFQQGFGALVGGSNLDTVERAGEVTLRQVRTDTSEIATFIVDAHLPRPAISASAVLSTTGNEVEVTVRNDTTETIENAVVIHGQEQDSLGDIAPGEVKTVALTLVAPSAASPTPDPMFPAGFVYPQPLINDPSLILGTSEYYNDPIAYPRWQLIQSHYSGESLTPLALPDPSDLVTLGGWLAGSAQQASLSADNTTQTGVTLLLLEIPVQ